MDLDECSYVICNIAVWFCMAGNSMKNINTHNGEYVTSLLTDVVCA